MDDEFKATCVIDVDPESVTTALTKSMEGSTKEDQGGVQRLILPGFPSFEPMPVSGAYCTVLELEPGKLLRVKKEHEPCAGTEIAITLEAEGSGTKITLVQSGFGSWFKDAKDTIVAHGYEIFADFVLFLERGIRVPPKNWGTDIGGFTRAVPTGLEVMMVNPEGLLQRAGIEVGDLLLSIRGVRIYDVGQLWCVQALSSAGDMADVTWARGAEYHSASAVF